MYIINPPIISSRTYTWIKCIIFSFASGSILLYVLEWCSGISWYSWWKILEIMAFTYSNLKILFHLWITIKNTCLSLIRSNWKCYMFSFFIDPFINSYWILSFNYVYSLYWNCWHLIYVPLVYCWYLINVLLIYCWYSIYAALVFYWLLI